MQIFDQAPIPLDVPDQMGCNFGTKTVSAFQTEIETKLGALTAGKSFSFVVEFSDSVAPMSSGAHTGYAVRSATNRYNVIMQRSGSTLCRVYSGNLNANGWLWKELALDDYATPYSFGTTTKADFETALIAYVGTFTSYPTYRPISVIFSVGVSPFSAVTYVGWVMANTSSRFAVALYSGSAENIVFGKYNGSYSWRINSDNSNTIQYAGASSQESNMNSITSTAGFPYIVRWIGGSTSNPPHTNNQGVAIGYKSSDNYETQVAIDNAGNMYARGKVAGTWKSWERNEVIVCKTVSGTTDANGNIVTNYSRGDYRPISACSGGVILIPYMQAISDGGKIAIKCLFANNMNPIANTQIETIWLYMAVVS